MRNYLLLLMVSSLAVPVTAGAPDGQTKPATKVTKTAKAVPAKGPRIVVEPAEHDFGKAQQNKTLTKEFRLKNTGTEELVIGEVATTCGCTAAQLTTKTLKPGDSTPLVVNLETRTVSGKLERYVMVSSNDPENKQLQVKVTADVAAPAAPAPVQ